MCARPLLGVKISKNASASLLHAKELFSCVHLYLHICVRKEREGRRKKNPFRERPPFRNFGCSGVRSQVPKFTKSLEIKYESMKYIEVYLNYFLSIQSNIFHPNYSSILYI